MTKRIDWNEPDRFKIERSEIFWPWGQGAVSIYQRSVKDPNRWELIVPDMAPSTLHMCGFPKIICRAASLTADDGHVRIIGKGRIKDQGKKITLLKRKPKPQLVRRQT